MTRYNQNNAYNFMDDLRKVYLFKKLFLTNGSNDIISEIISDALNVNKKHILENLEIYDINNETINLNYYKKTDRIICYVGNLEFIVRMHKNTKEKIFHENISYYNKNNNISEKDMYTYIIRIKNF